MKQTTKKLFLDTEFTGLRQNTTLISMGVTLENFEPSGCSFYAEFSDYDKGQVDEWLKENVISNLKFKDRDDSSDFFVRNKVLHSPCWEVYGNKEFVKEQFLNWLNVLIQNAKFESEEITKFEIVSDCMAYDWVLFCNLLGDTARDLPDIIHYIPIDISTMFWERGIDTDISRESFACPKEKDNTFFGKNKHNALFDAMIIQKCFERMTRDYNLNFAQALPHLLNGELLGNESNQQKYIAFYYVPANSYPAMSPAAQKLFGQNVSVAYKDYLAALTIDGTVEQISLSASDILNDTWYVVNTKQPRLVKNPYLQQLLLKKNQSL